MKVVRSLSTNVPEAKQTGAGALKSDGGRQALRPTASTLTRMQNTNRRELSGRSVKKAIELPIQLVRSRIGRRYRLDVLARTTRTTALRQR